MKARLSLLPILLGLFLAAVPARAQYAVYAVDYNSGNSGLYSIDPKNWTATFIGSTGQYLEALALSPSGQLFATSTAGNLYTLNAATGAATLIGSTGLGNIEALDFNGSTLVGATFGSSQPALFSINTATAATTTLVTATTTLGTVRSLAFIDSNTALLRSDATPAQLSSINLTTGVITSIGSITGTNNIYGMDLTPSGSLIGFDDNGAIYSINTATGATTLLGDTGSQLWLGATIQAIPEPSTWALFALGGGVVLITARRRRV